MSTTIPLQKAVEMALEQHQAGNFQRAERLYMEILAQDPGNIDAMHLLGVLAHQGKNPEAAVMLIGKAISRRGDVPIFHYNLAEAYVALGKFDEAVAAYDRAIELDPEYVQAYSNLSIALNNRRDFVRGEAAARRTLELAPQSTAAMNNLGIALHGQNRLAEAEAVYAQALAIQPDLFEALTNHALVLCALGRLEEGAAAYRRAIHLRPAVADTHNNLGTALIFLKRFSEAVEACQTAIDLKPDHLEANNNLGSALRSLGKHDDALRFFDRAIEINPDFAEGHANRGATLADVGRKAEALESVEKAIELRPGSAKMHFMRGVLLRDTYRVDEGIAEIKRAIELDPEDGGAYTALGYALLEQGDLDDAMEALTRGTDRAKDPITHSNMLMTANYHPGYTPAALLDMHRRWAEAFETPEIAHRLPHDNDRTPGRKLRVGYVSPDFRGHSVAYFLEPILAHHDHDAVEIYAYAQLVNVDLNTYRLRSQIDHWRETSSKPVAEVERMIRDDKIDILVDLAGHTGGNSLPLFARKPAPVQINMIGFPSTTGLASMDYRITDDLCDPVGLSDATNTETLVRMPGVFWVYQPPTQAGPVGNLPADDNGHVTFTSVNNFTKVTPQVQTMWARLLRAVPGSRLIIQTTATGSQSLQTRVKARFEAEGVSADRLDFRPWSNLTEYLSLLERSDVTLDPYPFNGGTTTCHSLWMGAPVLTLAGDRHASRMGLSMMTAIGLPQFVAHSPEQYVEIGQRVAADLNGLRDIRRGMRDRLLASPLLDGARYTRDLEKVYREVWAKWCATGV